MAKLALSNIALTAHDHDAELGRLAAMGLAGLEVAPSRVWRDTVDGPSPAEVTRYRKIVEAAGLRVVGLHSLLFDQPHLGLFGERRDRTLEFLVHLSEVCRDLGGRTLIYGGGRRRGSVPADRARAEAMGFLGELCGRVETHGTVFCFEPLGPSDSDFVNSALEALSIAEELDHPAFAVQLDAKALVENDEAAAATIRAVAHRLVHVHANEPGLGVLGTSGTIDHGALGRFLADIDYQGFVSIEQRMLNAEDPLADVARSAAVLRRHYR